MGVRDIAAAAVEAKKASDALERKRNQKRHGDRGVALVQERLGLTGKFVRARTDSPVDEHDWGNQTVVRVEDDGGPLYIKVRIVAEHTKFGGARTRTGTLVKFAMTDAEGGITFLHPSAEYRRTFANNPAGAGNGEVWERVSKGNFGDFVNLVGLSAVLRDYDAFMASKTPEDVVRTMGCYLHAKDVRLTEGGE